MAKDDLWIIWDPDYFKWVPDGHLYTNKDVEYISEALNAEYRILIDRTVDWRNNINPKTSNVAGIREFEDWLGLYGSSGMDLQARIDAVVAQLNKTLPYTWIRLHKMMAAIVGWGNFKLSRDRARIDVEIKQQKYSSWPAVWDLLEEVVPMNLYWVLIDKVTADPAEVKGVPGVRVNMTVDSPKPTGYEIDAHEHLGVYDYQVTKIVQTAGEGFREVEPHYTDEGCYISCGSLQTVRFVTGEPF